MTSVLMVASGFSRRRLDCGLRGVIRFLAAVRFFAMSWSSLDGVANAPHCTSVSHQHAFSIQTDRWPNRPGRISASRITPKNISRFAHLMCERAAGQPAEGPLSGPWRCGLIGSGIMSQRVLITAGAAGIGREFVRAFTANGAKVFVCDIDDKALAAIAKEIPGLIARRCDMASRAEIERMVPDAVAALGGLDVLINNAGIAGLTLPIAEYPPDDWDKVVAVNLTGMFDVSRLAIPHLKKSKRGCIINMSS